MAMMIVHGRQGDGKSAAAAALMRKFNCTVLVEAWNGKDRLPRGAMALTNLPKTAFRVPVGATAIEFQRALSLL